MKNSPFEGRFFHLRACRNYILEFHSIINFYQPIDLSHTNWKA